MRARSRSASMARSTTISATWISISARAWPALNQVANEAEDLRFFGGRYGILAEKPSPAWQFTLIDCRFDGQREAAIREHEASLTLVNVTFRNVPVAIDIDPDYSDWLWAKNTASRMSRRPPSSSATRRTSIPRSASRMRCAPRARRCSRASAKAARPATQPAIYEVKASTHGLILKAPGDNGARSARAGMPRRWHRCRRRCRPRSGRCRRPTPG